jgi:hypothetical protein
MAPVQGWAFVGFGLPGLKLVIPVDEVWPCHADGANGPRPAFLRALTNS